ADEGGPAENDRAGPQIGTAQGAQGAGAGHHAVQVELEHAAAIGPRRQRVERQVQLEVFDLHVGLADAEPYPADRSPRQAVHAVVRAHVQVVVARIQHQLPGRQVRQTLADIAPGNTRVDGL